MFTPSNVATSGSAAASAGKSSEAVPPTSRSPAPSAKTVSVLAGDRLAMRSGSALMLTDVSSSSTSVIGKAAAAGLGEAVVGDRLDLRTLARGAAGRARREEERRGCDGDSAGNRTPPPGLQGGGRWSGSSHGGCLPFLSKARARSGPGDRTSSLRRRVDALVTVAGLCRSSTGFAGSRDLDLGLSSAVYIRRGDGPRRR